MPTLRLSLAVHLESFDLPAFTKPIGPLFHRWIPDGQRDAILLTEDSASDKLSVWFERRAEKKEEFLHWKHDGKDFDVATMERQGKIDGGILKGEITLSDVSVEQLSALSANPVGIHSSFGQNVVEDECYVRLAKRVILFSQPLLGRFIRTLRSQYGQYWIKELHPWDSRKQSLGNYCSGLGLCWWDESKSIRYRLVPTNSSATMTVGRLPGRGYAEYLTQKDWRRLQRERCLRDPMTEILLLGQASRALDNGEYRQAFIEVTSALELAIAQRLTVPGDRPSVMAAIQEFSDKTSTKSQIVTSLLLLGFTLDSIEEVLAAIKIRNRVVHDGYVPSGEEANRLRGIMRTAATVCGLEDVKQPVLDGGNSLSPPES